MQSNLAIFLSPHFDDIPLSCGGVAARLARMGARCICLTVFAAPAPDGVVLSSFAQNMHEVWERASGSTIQAANELRREEERAAMKLLGLEPVWLELPDAPYRAGADGTYLYTSNAELFGTVAPHERQALVPQITAQISSVIRGTGVRGRVRVFAPLGVGHHVDHQLLFMAARRLGPRCGVLFYEDYPYAARHGALDARLAEIGLPVQPRLTPITDLIGVKIAAIARYKSQLGGLFDPVEDMAKQVRAYAQSVAVDAPMQQYAERVWAF